MAACSDLEERSSSSKEALPHKFYVEGTINHSLCDNSIAEQNNINETQEIYSQLEVKSNTGDLTTLSDDEFLHLLKEASTFNKPNNEESVLLKQLRKEVAETEPRENVNRSESNRSSELSEHSRNSKKILCGDSELTAVNCSEKQYCSFPNSTIETEKKSERLVRNREDSEICKDSSNSTVQLQLVSQQSQSLQEILNSDSRIRQRPTKSQRTISLSLDENCDINSDSYGNSIKSSKKSNKQVSSLASSKCDVNKTSTAIIYNTKVPVTTVFIADPFRKITQNGLENCIRDEDIPYHLLVNECDTFIEQSSKKFTANKVQVNPPIEIEMEDLKLSRIASADDAELNNNESSLKNSKFYVDSSVSSPEEQSASTGEDHNPDSTVPVVDSSILPWPEASQVQAFFDQNTYLVQNGKKISDINGNPFVATARSSSIASYVSTTFLDCPAESKNRKNKRSKNSENKGFLSESIAGYRGDEDIETLVKFINSSDKRSKPTAKSTSPNQILSYKTALHEHEKKRSMGKEFKNYQNKNIVTTVKKKLSHSSSMENISTVEKSPDQKIRNLESGSSFVGNDKQDSKEVVQISDVRNLDINSNISAQSENANVSESENQENLYGSELDRCPGQRPSSPDASSINADIYGTADVFSQTVEESGFLVVKKKQRKKHQGKRSDFRWRNTQAQRKKGMMLPLAESQCGKQDSRRKSTSSVPHSEHSSADNSDLDSVHSLPVRGSVPHPTQPHPHTTPSSSSSTPQASYADIARMPVSTLSSPASCGMTYTAQNHSLRQPGLDQDLKLSGSSPESTCTPLTKFGKASEITASCHKTSSKLSVSDTESMVESQSQLIFKSTREINTQTEPENMDSTPIAKQDACKTFHSGKKAEESPKSVCGICSCSIIKNSCGCPKSQSVPSKQKLKGSIPAVIMNNMPPESNLCNVSFGFGIEEVLEMAPTEELPSTSNDVAVEQQKIGEINSAIDMAVTSEKKLKSKSELNVVENFDNDIANKCTDKLFKENGSIFELCSVVSSCEVQSRPSSHLKTINYGTGKNISYSETNVNAKMFNHSAIAHFLGSAFHTVEEELNSDKTCRNGTPCVKYYIDSSEEA